MTLNDASSVRDTNKPTRCTRYHTIMIDLRPVNVSECTAIDHLCQSVCVPSPEQHQTMGKYWHINKIKFLLRGIHVTRAPVLASIDHRRVTVCLAKFLVQPTKLPLQALIEVITTSFDSLWPGAEVKVRKITKVGQAKVVSTLSTAVRAFNMALGARG